MRSEKSIIEKELISQRDSYWVMNELLKMNEEERNKYYEKHPYIKFGEAGANKRIYKTTDEVITTHLFKSAIEHKKVSFYKGLCLLDQEEQNYLKKLLTPFKNQGWYDFKCCLYYSENRGFYQLVIQMITDDEDIDIRTYELYLPPFSHTCSFDMYKKLSAGVYYELDFI